jgi:HAD superfamily hydrolase (TIGR01490 family)
MVEHGRLRAQSLGWPDIYSFTKALGERVAEEHAVTDALPISVLRPTIVQSSLHHPFPGWFDAYKMMDPIVLAYGRGILPDFPGLPEGVVDIVPVDIVVNATLAIAAVPPPPAAPVYYHVGSGARNPLTLRQLDDNIREYFQRHPLPDGARGHIRVPTWQFPGSRQVERALQNGERAVSAAERALLAMPASTRTRSWMSDVHKQQQKLDVLRRLSDLYGGYVEVEAVYSDTRTLALHRRLPADRVDGWGFDVIGLDWKHYLQEVHCPAITTLLRRSGSRRSREAAAAPLPPGRDVAAFFDLEGTVVASNLIETFLLARLTDRSPAEWPGEILSLLGSAPRLLALERASRAEFIRSFMRRYAGASESSLRRLVEERTGDGLLRRVLPEAVRQIRAHRAAQHRTVLITGTADLLVEPIRPLFDEVVASRLNTEGDVFTGYLEAPPLVGEARRAWVRTYAGLAGVDLSRSYAYGDSYSDRALLETVGHPVAINPDPKLYRHAKKQHWRIEQWGTHTQGPVEALMETVGSRGGGRP